MAVKLRPRYPGVPNKSAEAQIAGRRQRADNVEAAASPPPALIETQLKSIDDQLDRIEAKVDVVLDAVTDGDAPGGKTPGRKKT